MMIAFLLASALVIENAAQISERDAARAIAEICAGRPAVVIGGPLLAQRKVPWNGTDVPLEEFKRRMAALAPTSETLGPTAGFHPGKWWQARGWETLPDGRLTLEDGAVRLTTGGPLRQWDTWYLRENPLAPGDDLIIVEVRSDYANAQMSLELGGTKGERWFATLPVGTTWERHVLDAGAFVGPALKTLKDAHVRQIALGVSCQYTPKMEGRPSSLHVRLIGSRKNPQPGVGVAAIPFDRFPTVEGVWPAYKTYEKDGRLICVERPTGEGFGRGNVWRLKRGANAAEAILLERRSGQPERAVALFGYTRENDLNRPEVRQRIESAKRLLTEGALLFEAGSDLFAYLPGEEATLGAGWRGEAKALEITVAEKGADGRAVFTKRLAAEQLAGLRAWKCRWAIPKRPATYIVRTVLNGGEDEITHEFAMTDTAPAPAGDFITVSGSDFLLHGKKWYPVCVNFWPLYSSGTERHDYWNKWLANGYYSPNVVKKDLDALVALGGNAVSIQPAPRGCERNMTDFFRLCRERGVRVNLYLPFADPFMFDEAGLTNLLVQSRAALDPTVFAYDTSWEPGNHVFSAKRRDDHNRAWQVWVETQFGSVKAAEKAWGLSLGRDAKGFLRSPPNEAFKGGEAKWKAVMAAYRRFMDNMTAQRWNKTCRTMRRHAPNQLVSFRQGNTLPWDFALNGPVRHLDFVCPEGYSFQNTDEHECAIGFLTRYIDAYSQGKPIIWSEFGRSVWERSACKPLSAAMPGVAEYSRRFYRAGLETGANGFSPWWWPGGYRVDERSDYGIMNPDRTPRPAAEALAEYAAATKRPRERPVADEWITFDRDADAGGYCRETFGAGSAAYAAARTKGRTLGVRIAGTQYTSADCPAVALGDLPMEGKRPPKFLDAAFDALEVEYDGTNRSLRIRAVLGNPGPATWKRGAEKGGVALVAREAGSGRILAEHVLAKDVARFGTAAIDMEVAAERITLRLEALGRFPFGEERTIEIPKPADNERRGNPPRPGKQER